MISVLWKYKYALNRQILMQKYVTFIRPVLSAWTMISALKKYKYALNGKILLQIMNISEREEGVVALHLPTAPLKTRSGLEPVSWT